MATNYANDNVIVVLDRKCARQLLLALTLALGGTPIKTIVQGKKGKGGKGGGGGGGGKDATSPGTKKTSSKSAGAGGKLTTANTSGGRTARGAVKGKK